ncbi:alanine racemase [Corynebacterium aquatimens]|uniref:Alanine racemase n=1 Tax=Corynebacterium aquatimens TaxID=1190508 RepID=A0A931GSH2_9CORY|nr:alanine racemase [Corynebacterium aquatimens]MBG6123058.1 alanine racemase [Corynebacterium aquatimens]
MTQRTELGPDLLTARVNVQAITSNTAALKQAVGDTQLMCVVKADAYNHGVERCIGAMEAGGADAFGVATFEEATQLKSLTNKPVLAWIWVPGQTIPQGIELGVPTMQHLRYLLEDRVEGDRVEGESRVEEENAADQLVGSPLRVHLMLDTGMNRSGIDEEDWAEAFELARSGERNGTFKVVGLMSHLACADDVEGGPTSEFNQVQSQAFARGVELAQQMGLELERNHFSNSPATVSHENLRYEMVRPGIALYGLDPHPGFPVAVELEPAMSWVARVTAVKHITQGEGVSYGLTWTAPEDGWTAVIPAGYADGVQRNWQDHLEVTINGKRYPQVGRVCMDQFVVWLGPSEGHGVRVGDEAVIFGAGGMSATELAQRTGTINYEVVCSPTGRTVREFFCAPASGSTEEITEETAGGITEETTERAGDVLVRCETAEDTRQLGEQLGKTLTAGDVVILDGPLGAGKTTFTQGIATGLGVKGRVTSPTFIVAREHSSISDGPSLIHVDAYRLEGDITQLDALDLDTALEDAVVVAEWGAGLMEELAEDYIVVTLDRETAVREDPSSEARIIHWAMPR